MNEGNLQKDSGKYQGSRVSRKTANWMFSAYVLCLVINFCIAVYYVLKLGSIMFDPTRSLKSMALYCYHTNVIYIDAPALIYFFWVRHFFGREIKECDRRWGAKIRANTPT